MEHRQLGRSGLVTSVVGLAAYRAFNVTGDAAHARCESIVDAAMDSGVILFDTSPMYGHAEYTLAQALGERREEVVVATKVWARNRAQGELQIEQALSCFGIVDLYQVQNLLDTDSYLPRLSALKEQQRIAAVGGSHYLPSAMPKLMHAMRRHDVDIVEVPYHPRERTIEADLLSEAGRLGIGVIVTNPFGVHSLMSEAPSPESLAPLADFGVYTWQQAILKWILSDPRVHAVVVEAHNADEMREYAAVGQSPWFGGDERSYIRQLIGRQ